MQVSDTVSQPRVEAAGTSTPELWGLRTITDRTQYRVYALALLAAIAVWLIPIRAPLWLDETVSMYLIRGGFAGIISRQVWPDSPTYSCLLWLWTEVMGKGEVALRISSILPMLAAVYLLYRAARELLGRDVAPIAAIVFCIHTIIIFAAIDIRPYAFAALALNATIFALVSLRHNSSNWLAALFGLAAACIVQFQLLFAVILPALLLCFVVAKWQDRKTLWRQLGVALPVFAVACLPAIPRLQYMYHTSATHVFAEAPRFLQMLSTLTLQGVGVILAVALVVAASTRRLHPEIPLRSWPTLLCASLALVPIVTLYVLSLKTSIHVFVPRYRLVAVPGIALCWALVASWIDSRVLRLLVCGTAVVATAAICLSRPFLRQHQYSWKYALSFVEKNAAVDNAPVLICSDIPESDHMPMPVGAAIEETGILPPLSYYRLTVPVAALPRSLNDEAMRDASQFLQQQDARHGRFLAMAFVSSYETLDWLAKKAAATDDVQELGKFDGVRVVEFKPRP